MAAEATRGAWRCSPGSVLNLNALRTARHRQRCGSALRSRIQSVPPAQCKRRIMPIRTKATEMLGCEQPIVRLLLPNRPPGGGAGGATACVWCCARACVWFGVGSTALRQRMVAIFTLAQPGHGCVKCSPMRGSTRMGRGGRHRTQRMPRTLLSGGPEISARCRFRALPKSFQRHA